MVQFAVSVYLINALCKYFLPGIVTKILPLLAVGITLVGSSSLLKLKIKRLDKFFVLFLFVWFLGCFYSANITKGLGYVFSFSVALLFGIYVSYLEIDEDKIMKLLAICCFIMECFLILQPQAPEIVEQVTKLFSYDSNDYIVMKSWARNGWYSGLFPDRAPAAFYCSVLVGTGLYYTYRNYKKSGTLFAKFLGIILLSIGVYGILLTAKRGLLLGTLIAAFITYIVYKKVNREPVWKICVTVGVISVIAWLVFSNMEATQIMLMRFFDNDNMMTGRSAIYDNVYRYIWSSPIIGTGTASAFSLLGIGGHNIYLTVFMENGIIGFTLFILALLYSLCKTIALALKMGRINSKEYLPFLMFSLFIQIFFLIYGMSGNPLYDNYILYFYLFAVLIVKYSDFQLSKNMKEEY
nr:O-antigen ligase family protein [uncultured Mediterraneibacter sp.]